MTCHSKDAKSYTSLRRILTTIHSTIASSSNRNSGKPIDRESMNEKYAVFLKTIMYRRFNLKKKTKLLFYL